MHRLQVVIFSNLNIGCSKKANHPVLINLKLLKSKININQDYLLDINFYLQVLPFLDTHIICRDSNLKTKNLVGYHFCLKVSCVGSRTAVHRLALNHKLYFYQFHHNLKCFKSQYFLDNNFIQSLNLFFYTELYSGSRKHSPPC